MEYKPEGASSEAIYLYFTKGKTNFKFTPKDYEDFGRCYRLLKHYPEWYDRMTEMKNISNEWEKIGNNWDMLTNLYNNYLITKNINLLREINKFLEILNETDEEWIFI